MTISLAANRVPWTAWGHLQLVRGGQEIEVQAPLLFGSPLPVLYGFWDFGSTPTKPHAVPPDQTIGDPDTYSIGAVTLLPESDEDGVWSLFQQARENLMNYKLPYDYGFNSNSYANTLLSIVGLSASSFVTYPNEVIGFPGIDQDAAQGHWGIDYDLVGGSSGDFIRGGRGDDTLAGGGGVDFLHGGRGSDILYGGTEATPVDGVADYLYGGSGRDSFYVGNYHGPGLFYYDFNISDYNFNDQLRGTYDVIMDYSQFDTVFVTIDGYWDPFDNVEMGSYTLIPTGYSIGGKDEYEVDGIALHAIRDSYFDANLGYTISVVVFYEPEMYTPIFAIRESGGPSVFSLLPGTSGDDVIVGTAGADTIYAGDGDDEISGDAGDDLLYGENGDDVFYAQEGDGADLYDGGAGKDHLYITTTNNTTVDLQSGTISASGEGNDSIVSVEAFTAGSGNDLFVDAAHGVFYDGGVGTDTVAFEFEASQYRIVTSGSGYLVERAYVDRDAGYEDRYLYLKSIENVTFGGVTAAFIDVLTVETVGTAGADTLIGTSRNDAIFGGAGDDILYGGYGSDLLDGGEGNNQLRYDGAASDYTFKQNNDGTISIVSAVYGYDVALNFQTVHFLGENATYDIAALFDEPGTIVGTSGNDTLSGTSGDDILRGGKGDDVLQGGWGSDRYKFSVGDGHDSIDDWDDPSSLDVLELGPGITPASVTVERGTVDYWDAVLNFGNGDSVTIKGGFFSPSSVIEEIRFADNTVWTMSDVRQAYLDRISTTGNDTIDGFFDDDIIHAKAGDDTIYGNAGNDTIYGEAGEDLIFGGEGDDIIIGGTGNDFMLGEVGADTFVFNDSDGHDWIDDFEVGVDKIDLRGVVGVNDFSDVLATAQEWVSGSTWIYADANNYIRLEGVSKSSLQASDFIFN